MRLNGSPFGRSWHSAQLDCSAVLESGARAGHEVTDGARNEDLPGAGQVDDPRRDVHGDSGDAVIPQFALPGVDARVAQSS
ncbi:hypothetical protein AWB99_18175 [Mycolicibacterium confluentis]|nr:hypothetical protein AWB99_18175 [Mycolicibacterium confluentis]